MSLRWLVGALESGVVIVEPNVLEMVYVVDRTSIVTIDGLEGGGFGTLRGRHTGKGRIGVVSADHSRIAV